MLSKINSCTNCKYSKLRNFHTICSGFNKPVFVPAFHKCWKYKIRN